MTEAQPSVTSVAVKYGLITALVGVVYSVILMVTDIGDNRIFSSIAYVIMIAGILLAMKHYKEMNYGYMSYSQGLGIGSIVSLIFGFLNGVFTWLYTTFIDPDYMARVMEKQRILLIEKGLTDEQIDQSMKMAENFQGPITMIFGAAVITLIVGFLLSLIFSAVMKNSKPEFE
jgi:DNA-binding XRE family transcriptional regulator